MLASSATSSRRKPGVRRRRAAGSPTSSGERRARRVRKNSASACLRAACEENLRQLGLEQLHLVHCRYMEDADVPFAESVGVLADLQREGLIRHVGVSNVTLAQLREAQAITTVVSVQNFYNLAYRQHEELLEVCTREDIAFIPFFPWVWDSSDKVVML